MKKFLSLVSALLLVGSSFAVDQVNTLTSATTSNLISGAVQITSLEVINNNPSNSATVLFYDAPSTSVTWTNGAFTAWASYVTNLISYSTSYYGVITTNTNRVTYKYASTTAAASQSYKLLKSVTVGVGASYTWEPIGGVFTSYGLTATNNQTNITINSTWSNITR